MNTADILENRTFAEINIGDTATIEKTVTRFPDK